MTANPGLHLKVPSQEQKLAVLRRQQVQVVFECVGAQLQAAAPGMRWDSKYVGEIWDRESGSLSVDDPDRKNIITVDHWPASERTLAEVEGWPQGFDMVIRVFHHDTPVDTDGQLEVMSCANCGQELRKNQLEVQG